MPVVENIVWHVQNLLYACSTGLRSGDEIVKIIHTNFILINPFSDPPCPVWKHLHSLCFTSHLFRVFSFHLSIINILMTDFHFKYNAWSEVRTDLSICHAWFTSVNLIKVVQESKAAWFVVLDSGGFISLSSQLYASPNHQDVYIYIYRYVAMWTVSGHIYWT